MRRWGATLLLLTLAVPIAAQTSKPAPRRPRASPAATPQTVPADLKCPTPLGPGVSTQLSFCDVMSGRDPAGGILVTLPLRKGQATLTFDLHNRHTYSEEQVKTNRAYTRYTATIGVLTMDNTLITRAVVQNEFRNANDLVDRVGGGAGPSGVKAVAPTGTEHITVVIPEGEDQVSLLGEKVTMERLEGNATYSSPGRPIAVISNAKLEYTPVPPPRPRRPAPKSR